MSNTTSEQTETGIPSTEREPASRSWLLGGTADALYNSRVYAEKHRLNAEIGKRTIPIIGGMWSNLLYTGETWIMRPLRMATGLVIGATKVDPEKEIPEVPAELGSLQKDLPESYRNRVEVAEGKNQSVHGILGLSPTEYQKGKSRAEHAEAVAEVRSLPEEQLERSQAIEARLAKLEKGGRSNGEEALGGLNSPVFRDTAKKLVDQLVTV